MTDRIVALCLEGRISPAVALARLVFAGMTPEEIAPLLPASSGIAALFAAQRANLAATADMIRESAVRHDDPDPDDQIAAIASMFDRAVARSPEASVAAYSLGDGALLAATTREVVDWLFANDFADQRTDALDLGCGIGRVAGALSPHVRSVVGLDVSAGMIAEANRRHKASNLRFLQTTGTSATGLPGASKDLILAVDSMPYLVQAGIARGHVAEARRLLRPGGQLVILNLSYRGDVADIADARAWASAFGLSVLFCGERPFTIWDGAAYVLRREKP